MTASEIAAIIDKLDNLKDLDREQHDRLEGLIKNNYSNLHAAIGELKENFKILQMSDRDQEVAIAKLKAYAEGLKKELDEFRDNERAYGRQMSAEISKLKGLPWKFAGVMLTTIAIIITAGGIIINMILTRIDSQAAERPAARIEAQP